MCPLRSRAGRCLALCPAPRAPVCCRLAHVPGAAARRSTSAWWFRSSRHFGWHEAEHCGREQTTSRRLWAARPTLCTLYCSCKLVLTRCCGDWNSAAPRVRGQMSESQTAPFRRALPPKQLSAVRCSSGGRGVSGQGAYLYANARPRGNAACSRHAVPLTYD